MGWQSRLIVCQLLVAEISLTWGNIFNADMENGAVCTRVLPIPVDSTDIYNIYAEPPQDGRGVRDKCTLRFYSTTGEAFKIYVRDLIFRECQIFVRLYDGDPYLNTPRYSFGCNSPSGNVIRTFNSEIALRLEKPDSTSTGYKFYFRLALNSGPDVGGDGFIAGEDSGMSVGMIVGIVIACVLVLAVAIAIILYALFIYRRKREEKELEMTRSRSVLFPPSMHDGGSVHSSKHSLHSTHSTHSTHFTKDTSQLSYPAFRTKPSISEKAPKCNSIDTKSFDSETADNTDNVRKPILVKDVRNEFNAMKKGLEREKRRKEQEEEDLRMQERRWKGTRQADRKNREESNRGFNRANRNKNDRVTLNEENVRRSSRADRQRSRSHHDDDSFQRSNRAGSSRSTRTRDTSRSRAHSPARSGGAWSEPDYISKHRESSRERDQRERERSNSASRRRSHSSGTQSRRKRDYYDDRDAYSDYDYDERHRSHSRDRHNSYRSQRSGTQRSRSNSHTRHHR